MSEHAIVTSTTTSDTKTTPPVGTPFFPIAGHEHADAIQPAGGVRPYPFVDDDAGPEPEVSPETKLNDSKEVVTHAFGWMSNDAEARLSALETDLRTVDEPSFGEQLVRAAFRTALSAATSGASEYVAGLFVSNGSDALRELVKSAIESGLGEAAELGANALRGSKEPLTAFIAAQKAAVRHLYRKAQASWIHRGRHQVTTQEQADMLEATLTRPQMQAAASSYYIEARDAWVTYLAQARYGVRHSKALDENYDIVDIGPTTDLTPEDERENANELRPGAHSTTDSPDLAAAFLGAADGVMVVQAELPSIRAIENTGYYGMSGTPIVTHAYLNGVNSIIRDQFVGQQLASAAIPRVIHCRVAGGDSFTVRINEKGIVFSPRESFWLRARAIADRPWNLGQPDVALEQIGLQILLAELIPAKILTGTSE